MIGADNIIIDGNGYSITYSESSEGYGVDNSGGYDNVTIKNVGIQQGSENVNSYGIYFSVKDDSGMTGLLQIEEGNCTGSVKSAQRSIVSGSELLIVRAKICS